MKILRIMQFLYFEQQQQHKKKNPNSVFKLNTKLFNFYKLIEMQLQIVPAAFLCGCSRYSALKT